MDNPVYQYQPLEPGHIRVLRLAPGETCDPLVGELQVVALQDEDFMYDALSYVWGDPAPVDAIRISGLLLPIADNLREALRHLRYPDIPLVIWVDAICINQKDLKERAEQVQSMRLIFSHAKMVRAWMSEPFMDTTCGAFKGLQNFVFVKDPDVHFGLGKDPYFWRPIMQIFRNSYWTRVWIQQEVLNARNMMVHVNGTKLPGDSLSDFEYSFHAFSLLIYGEHIDRAEDWATLFHPFTEPILALRHYKQRARKVLTLYSVINSSQALATTDPRDRVYALMHVAVDYAENGITVDYSKSELDVLLDAAEYHLMHNGTLSCLEDSMLTDRDNDDLLPGLLPQKLTWLPQDWLLRDPSWFRTGLSSLIAPSWCNWAEVTSHVSLQRSTQQLRVRGIRVDNVKKMMTGCIHTASLTAQQFWTSPFGTHLRKTNNVKAKVLSKEVSRLLVGEEGENISHHRVCEALLSCLSLLDASDTSDQYISYRLRINASFDPHVIKTLHCIFMRLNTRQIIMTETRKLGLVPKCLIQEGDEVWIVLGCHLPIILRPQSDGTHWHICAADIPKWQDSEELAAFQNDCEPGDRIGDWTVQDINIA